MFKIKTQAGNMFQVLNGEEGRFFTQNLHFT
jgi:hypothetical protein